ncbi:hypothetical protein GGI09_003886 [Coemansia sp. S100]|nr:hypothetical protein GGI09_003886 [Coemansia sp. S100]
MGLPLSPFQTLPMLVVCKVVEYLEGHSTNSFELSATEHHERKVILTPLLLVSERWRTAALESICDNCELAFIHSRRAFEVRFPAWPADYSYPRFRKTHLVKQITVSAFLWKDMCDGAFCDYESMSFPAAKTISLVLHKTTDKDSSSASVTSQEKVVAFTRSLLQFTPIVASVIVKFESVSNAASCNEQLYGTLISELYQGRVSSVDVYSGLNGTPLSLSLTGTTGLTSIAHGSNISCAPFASLAHLNARTLKTLEIIISEEKNWLDLLYGGTETPTAYTSLTTLVVEITDIPYDAIWAAIEDGEPFPVLSTLVVEGKYPFNDGLLFRGNGKTLQSLSIPFSAIARNVLGRFSVLKRSGVTRMAQICIGDVTEMDTEFLAGRAGVATLLDYTGDTTNAQTFSSIKTAPTTAILQHLRISKLQCSVTDFIKMIVALPSLVSFTCDIHAFGPDIEEIPANDRPSILRAKYYPLSSNFRVLRVPDIADGLVSMVADAAKIIAILCPNFAQVDLSLKLRNKFSREVAWAMVSDPFEPYANSLRRLVYRG